MSGLVLHPLLGISRPDGEWPKRCSKCAADIPEAAAPLMLWDETGELMWVYCHACETPVFTALTGKARDHDRRR